MKRVWERQEASIGRTIRKVSKTVAQPAPGRWEILLSNGRTFGVSGILDAEWLMLETPLAHATRIPPAAALLRANASLAGLAKYADRGRGQTSIQAEIPTTDGVPLAARLEETLRGFSTAYAFAVAQNAGHAPDRIGDTAVGSGFADHRTDPPRAEEKRGGGVPSPDAGRRLAETIRRGPWVCHERDDGSIAVELETDRGYHRAVLATHESGAFEASVPIAEWRSPSADSREAAARLLLAANHGMRMGRASILEESDRWTARVEVRFASDPGETELRHLLAALAVACRHWARELQSLEKESTARAYLAVRAVRA